MPTNRKLLKVTIEYEDMIQTVVGDEAEKWQQHNESLAMLGWSHGMNPFDLDPIRWQVVKKEKEREP